MSFHILFSASGSCFLQLCFSQALRMDYTLGVSFETGATAPRGRDGETHYWSYQEGNWICFKLCKVLLCCIEPSLSSEQE